MSKYLNKTPEQLRKDKAEIEAAFEKIQSERADILGPIFLRIIDSIDDEKRAKAYYDILEKNATKEEKKQLKSMLKSLKSIFDSGKSVKETVVDNEKSFTDSDNSKKLDENVDINNEKIKEINDINSEKS